MIQTYQQSDLLRLTRGTNRRQRRCKRCGKIVRSRRPSLRNRGLLFEDDGSSFIGMSVFLDQDSDTYIAPLANPTGGGSGSGSTPCCCCECSFCKFGTTPATEQLIASGIDYTLIVNMCFLFQVGSAKITSAPANPNGIFPALIHDRFLNTCCGWGGQVSADDGGFFGPGGQINGYSSTDCTGTFDTQNLVHFNWGIARGSGEWFAACFCQREINGEQLYLFVGSTPATDGDDCNGTITISNALGPVGTNTVFEGNNYFGIATGGSIVVSPP